MDATWYGTTLQSLAQHSVATGEKVYVLAMYCVLSVCEALVALSMEPPTGFKCSLAHVHNLYCSVSILWITVAMMVEPFVAAVRMSP